MKREMYFYYDDVKDVFSLVEKSEKKFSTVFRYYVKRFGPLLEIVDDKSRRVVGYTNEGGDLSEDYEELKKLLKENPIEEKFDIPELGLSEANMDKIIDAIYEKHVMNKVAAK